MSSIIQVFAESADASILAMFQYKVKIRYHEKAIHPFGSPVVIRLWR
jgi:hypothetical protein